ncbi:MAG: hypothetical protein WD023_06640 [Ilumatobacteraceae bacterium]
MSATPTVLDALVLGAQVAATWSMVGLIWFVQVVHYPLFGWVGDDVAVPYAVEHQRRTALVVGLPMAVEGVTALWLFADPPVGSNRVLPFVGLVLLAVVHASTVLLQVPQHAALARANDTTRIRRLVRSNWIRTVAWTARGIVTLVLLVRALRG